MFYQVSLSKNSFLVTSAYLAYGGVRNCLRHGICIATTGIIVLPYRASTIAMLLPEGNCGIVFSCCFEMNFVDAGFFEAGFYGFEKARTYAITAVSVENVDCDDVAAGFFVGAEAEADWFAADYCDEAIGAGKIHVSAEFGAGIGDGGRVAGLVDFVEGFEIFGSVGPESDSRGHGGILEHDCFGWVIEELFRRWAARGAKRMSSACLRRQEGTCGRDLLVVELSSDRWI